ncbi:oxetanocin A resistance protein [Mangrovactinospora gilvigrisea]|uniref:Oxetanocin A resistance protein n=1 Tax=Mangrovactinospora gilvigrisea TaxID=1428644 RepID=A0A1J7C802_9ACTN|nr:pentapeptide repeat-containing protein [Mangrovactinospora gilvigrisea]OIV35770.1 oxetanocin A resistance protein [Mangrovactinospora gilvigrisea]
MNDATDETPLPLRADCSRCSGLCCTALPFARSTGNAAFAENKPAGRPCRHLRDDSRCGIHDRLRESGWSGCTVFDCLGAGQQTVQVTFGGRDWHQQPRAERERMFTAFAVLRQVHELVYFAAAALAMRRAAPVHPELERIRAALTALAGADADTVLAADPGALRAELGPLLARASELQRGPDAGPDRRNADLIGRDLRKAALRGADLRGAYLIAADLTGADLRGADLLGADLRDTRLADADLTGALYLTPPQLAAASGGAGTRLPAGLPRPAHWPR